MKFVRVHGKLVRVQGNPKSEWTPTNTLPFFLAVINLIAMGTLGYYLWHSTDTASASMVAS